MNLVDRFRLDVVSGTTKLSVRLGVTNPADPRNWIDIDNRIAMVPAEVPERLRDLAKWCDDLTGLTHDICPEANALVWVRNERRNGVCWTYPAKTVEGRWVRPDVNVWKYVTNGSGPSWISGITNDGLNQYCPNFFGPNGDLTVHLSPLDPLYGLESYFEYGAFGRLYLLNDFMLISGNFKSCAQQLDTFLDEGKWRQEENALENPRTVARARQSDIKDLQGNLRRLTKGYLSTWPEQAKEGLGDFLIRGMQN